MTTPDPTSDTSRKALGYVTLGLTVAARFMEVHMRRREQESRAADAQAREVARALQEQTRAEAAVVKYDLRDVGRKEWWDSAAVEQVAGGYAAARAYSHVDPELAGVARHMAGEIGRRYGIDADQLVSANEEATRAFVDRGITPPEVRLVAGEDADLLVRTQEYVDSIDQRGFERRAAEQLGMDPAAERARMKQELAEASALITEANIVDQQVYADGVVTAKEAGQDLPRADATEADGQRHQDLAARLQSVPEMPADAVEARTIADVAQARPVVEATAATKAAAKAPKPRGGAERGAELARGR